MQFEWDPTKAAGNLTKHGVSFDEASSIFGDRLAVSILDPDHSVDEDRYLTTGLSSGQRLLVVAHVYRDASIRIITAREANRLERKQYESEQ
jgi:uncharacterized DUF497 family protein